jgi:hypothetical protein
MTTRPVVMLQMWVPFKLAASFDDRRPLTSLSPVRFVACVSENFSVAADSAKRERQLHFYLDASSIKPRETSWMDRLNPKRMFSAKPVSSEGPKLPPSLVLPSKPAAARDDADPSAQVSRTCDTRCKTLAQLTSSCVTFLSVVRPTSV